jgi:broad specificity phosphatase PhoE
MRRRRAERSTLARVLAAAALAAALSVAVAGCTGLAENDPSVTRGPSGAAAVEEAQAAAVAIGGEAMVAALRRGGFVLVFQHASTDRRAERRVDLANCATQRNLSVTGRQQAVQLGVAVQDLRIPVSTVVTSPFCRARDTGWLAFGRAERGEDLGPPPAGASEMAAAAAQFRARLATPPPLGGNTVLVTHTETIAAVLGMQLKPGEVLAYHTRQDDQPVLVRRFSVATLLVLARSATGSQTSATDVRRSALPEP